MGNLWQRRFYFLSGLSDPLDGRQLAWWLSLGCGDTPNSLKLGGFYRNFQSCIFPLLDLPLASAWPLSIRLRPA